MHEVKYTTLFKKELRLMAKQGKDIEKLKTIVKKLANLEKLEPKYQNHALKNNKKYKNCNELHIEPDWILVYKYINNNTLVLLLIETGSHSEIL